MKRKRSYLMVFCAIILISSIIAISFENNASASVKSMKKKVLTTTSTDNDGDTSVRTTKRTSTKASTDRECRGSELPIERTSNGDASEYNNIGRDYADRGNYEKAIEYYDLALDEDPDLVAAMYNKGAALANQGEYREAIRAYNLALEEDPDHVNALIGKGAALANQGEYREAIRAYNLALEEDPSSALAFYNKGAALANQGEYREAIRAYNLALEEDPGCTKALNAKNSILMKLEDDNYSEPSPFPNKRGTTTGATNATSQPACPDGGVGSALDDIFGGGSAVASMIAYTIVASVP